MTMTERPFNERVKEAIASGSSKTAADMIAEAERISAQAVDDAKSAKVRALDPLLDDAEIEAARKAATDAEFLQARMAEAVRVLSEKVDTFRRAEDQVRLRGIYDAAAAKRDAAAERLKAYPALANAIGEILAEVLAADHVVAVANGDLPAGVAHLKTAEALVRGSLAAGETPPLPMTRIKLPALAYAHPGIFGPVYVGGGYEPRFTPEITNADEVGDLSSSDRTDGAGAKGPASPSVRLVPRMTGEAA